MELIRVNGRRFDKSSVRLKIAGVKFEGWTDFKYGDKRERAKVMGVTRDGRPLGVTEGKYEADESALTMFLASADQLRKLVAARSVSIGSFGQPTFPITCQYVGPTGAIVTDQLFDCWIAGQSTSIGAESADPIKVEIPIGVSYIVWGGLSLSDTPTGF